MTTSKQTRTLVLRADASIGTGAGHVMRCLALAEAWRELGGKCLFVMAESTPAIEERVRGEAMQVEHIAATPGTHADIRSTKEVAARVGPEWIVLDGYKFSADYQSALKDAGLHLLYIDDNADASSYVADLILNQNPHATDDAYHRRSFATRLLLGPRYALLRQEFAVWRDWHREIAPEGRRVVLTMGGSDPDNVTLMVLTALEKMAKKGLEVAVALGGSNPHCASIELAMSYLSFPVWLLKDVPNMPELMAGADMAISSAGSTWAELCFMGLPAVLIDIAENQTQIACSLASAGIALHAGNSRTAGDIILQTERLLANPLLREQISRAGRSLVDGRGAARVAALLMEQAADRGRPQSCSA